ncbi:MAG: replicative DNA helicase [Lachnoclostridium sp.]|jgi:replicative DNA helicase|nr:replicative DNA helicase [Lachnoclostridium sp.]
MEENAIRKIMPHSTEAERSLIGAMLIDSEAIILASELLIPDDFYTPQFRTLFESMVELYEEGKPSDIAIIQNRLKEKSVLPEYSSPEFLASIADSSIISVNAKHYAEIIKEKSILRNLIRVTEKITADCYRGEEPLNTLLENAERDVFRIVQNQSIRDFIPIKEIAINTLKSIQLTAKQSGKISGLATGFRDLDYLTSGFHPSQLIVIGSRPGMGKTAFALSIAENISVRKDTVSVVFNLEMDETELAKRLISMDSKVTLSSITNGMLAPDNWGNITQSVKNLGGSHLILDSPPGLTITELRSKCRKLKLERPLDLVIIDYLQLMSGSGRRNESRQQEVSEISRSLKILAREIECPIIAFSQLNRELERRENKRPMMSDLRESGSIEQDADIVMFLYNDEYYNKDTEEKGITEIIIGKQRNGRTGTIKLAWLPEYTTFGNLESDSFQ